MALLNSLYLRGAKKRLGGAVLYTSAGRTIARELAPEAKNPKTAAQMSRRVKWANLVNFYRISKQWMPKCYESKPANNSYYNRFMSLNVNNADVSLPKEAARQGAVVAAPYMISQGSLPSIEVTELSTGEFVSSLRLGTLSIDNGTTVAQFSEALIRNNGNIREGMQLSFISYQQTTNNETGTPYCVCGWYEVTLDLNDTQLLNGVMPITFAAATITTDEKYLGTGVNLSSGAFAWILSEKRGGKLYVSTQRLNLCDAYVYVAFSSQAAMNTAILSYGLGKDEFLQPGYSRDGAVPQPGVNSIAAVVLDDRYYTPGVDGLNGADILNAGGKATVRLANALPAGTVANVEMTFKDTSVVHRKATGISVSGLNIEADTFTPAFSSAVGNVDKVIVTLSTGQVFTAEFPAKTNVD